MITKTIFFTWRVVLCEEIMFYTMHVVACERFCDGQIEQHAYTCTMHCYCSIVVLFRDII